MVEVSDSTLDTDRIKARTYGAAGIPEYWLVNLVERRLERYTTPDAASETGYAALRVLGPDDSATVCIDTIERGAIQVATLLP